MLASFTPGVRARFARSWRFAGSVFSIHYTHARASVSMVSARALDRRGTFAGKTNLSAVAVSLRVSLRVFVTKEEKTLLSMFFRAVFAALAALLSRIRPRSSSRRRGRRGRRILRRRRRNDYRSRPVWKRPVRRGDGTGERAAASGSPTRNAGSASPRLTSVQEARVSVERRSIAESNSALSEDSRTDQDRSPSTINLNRSPSAIELDCSPSAIELDRSPSTIELDRSPFDTDLDHSPSAIKQDHSPSAIDHSPSDTDQDHSPSVIIQDPSHSAIDHSPSDTDQDHSPSVIIQDPSHSAIDHSPSDTDQDHSPSTTGQDPSHSHFSHEDHFPSAINQDPSHSPVDQNSSLSAIDQDLSPPTTDSHLQSDTNQDHSPSNIDHNANSINSSASGETLENVKDLSSSNLLDRAKPAMFISDLTMTSCSSKDVSENEFVGHSAQSVTETITNIGKGKGKSLSSDAVKKSLGQEAPVLDVNVPCLSLNTVVILDTRTDKNSQGQVNDLPTRSATEIDDSSELSASEGQEVTKDTVVDNALSSTTNNEKCECGSVYHRAQRSGIALEDIRTTADGRTVMGLLLVRNDCYKKRVGARHSATGWANYQDTLAKWVESVEDGEFDRFEFRVEVPGGGGNYHMELAFFCNQYWDNNEGKNHVVSCTVF